MTMQDLEGKRVKISAHTITVKDEHGKTRGMVRGVEKYTALQPSKRFDHFPAVKKAGIWGNDFDRKMIDHVIVDGKQLYYLNDLGALEQNPIWEGEVRCYQERLRIAEQAAQYMTVINCYIS